jgi:hypothetical protein
MKWRIPRPGWQVRLVASLLAASAMSLGTVAWASAQTVTSDVPRQSVPVTRLSGASLERSGCPDPMNCTPPQAALDSRSLAVVASRAGCPDPYNCTPPQAALDSRSLAVFASGPGCPDPKNCTVP